MEEGTPPEETSNVTVRKKTVSSKEGWEYHISLVGKRLIKSAKRLQDQINQMNSYIEQGTNCLEEELSTENLDTLLFDLMEHVVKKKELLSGAEPEEDNHLDAMIDNFDDQIFEVKKKFNQLHRQTSAAFPQHESVEHKSVSYISANSKFSKSSARAKNIVAWLEAERLALLSAQEQEVRMEVLRVEEESKLALEIKKANQQVELLRMEEEIAKVSAMEIHYRMEEAKRASKLNSDCSASNISNLSKQSSLAKKKQS